MFIPCIVRFPHTGSGRCGKIKIADDTKLGKQILKSEPLNGECSYMELEKVDDCNAIPAYLKSRVPDTVHFWLDPDPAYQN